MTAEKRSNEGASIAARKVGSIVLAYLSGLVADADAEWPVHRNSKPFDFALADLRALMAEHEERSREAASTAAECARLRAAMGVLVDAAVALRAHDAVPTWPQEWSDLGAAVAQARAAIEERSGAAASTAGVKP